MYFPEFLKQKIEVQKPERDPFLEIETESNSSEFEVINDYITEDVENVENPGKGLNVQEPDCINKN